METRVDHLPLQLTTRPERDEKLGVYSIILLWFGALLWLRKNFLVFRAPSRLSFQSVHRSAMVSGYSTHEEMTLLTAEACQ